MSSVVDEHEIETFIRVRDKFSNLHNGMDTITDGSLCKALDNLASLPFMTLSTCSTKTRIHPRNCTFAIGGNDVGTFANPDLYQILQTSTVSSFGKGDKWVMDLAYRDGREIQGELVDIGRLAHGWLQGMMQEIEVTMFVGRKLSYRMHKLAVYAVGGHFDWHLDATHSKEHQATLLVALNTFWEGGDLLLRRHGIEIRPDMHPKVTDDQIDIQAVVFYTDTEHKVEPVTKGARIVLQFDILVIGWEPYYDDPNFVVELIEQYATRSKHQETDSMSPDLQSVEPIVSIIWQHLRIHEDVAFALQYLYRRSCILPEYLKGYDALIYHSLIKCGDFEVSLHPVVLVQRTDYYGNWEGTTAYIYDDPTCPDVTTFHLNKASGVALIHAEEYIRHRRNEPEPGEIKYFSGGMFVRFKD